MRELNMFPDLGCTFSSMLISKAKKRETIMKKIFIILLLAFVALVLIGASCDSLPNKAVSSKQEILLSSTNVDGFVVKIFKTDDWGFNKVVCLKITSAMNGNEYLNEGNIILGHDTTTVDENIGESGDYHMTIIINRDGTISGKSHIKQNF